ncbi:MAG: hypothetical protein CME65_01440 [Halobacteriovoraceae bacterium]|nr:hypothetical protein [Halobacteriovoraceae bacterium]|tara:strand:- start:4766 stop:6805 length:2040 start_codon:yes stop_codon:yes gene_type:complete
MVHANAFTKLTNLVMSQAMTLDERLACIFSQRGGKKTLSGVFSIEDVHGFNGFSGYNYWHGDQLVAQLHLASLISGTYVLYKYTNIEGVETKHYDYFDSEGNFFYESQSLDGEAVIYGSIAMDPTSPFINQIYNILHQEYENASRNFGSTSRIAYLEKLLKSFYEADKYSLSVNAGSNDFALANIDNEILKIERDTVLTYKERQDVYKDLRRVKSKVVKTKKRAHSLPFIKYALPALLTNIIVRFKNLINRPLNNLKGLMHRHSVGHVQWFGRTVQQNLGLSIAMAIYGPFTFYFITQPMNPHAMWAVGKVRGAYIEMVDSISGKKPDQNLIYQDKVSTKTAAIDQKKDNADKTWQNRMDRFKAMQIAYEESLVFAARIGRIEQFEQQFNFPLTAEAAWMEMELYLQDIESILQDKSNLDRDYTAYLQHEIDRTIELQVYIWRKMAQFFLDHPYIVVDQNNEQTERNYYVGRQFIFFEAMTEKLSKLSHPQPETHGLVGQLAKDFRAAKLEGNSILDTLKKNSKLFRQKELFNSDEHRDYMARQWEVLFLQQNKKQEAASFALQSYTWSVKNAIWILQTFTSAKRSELGILSRKFQQGQTQGSTLGPVAGMNEYLENMYHNLTMEYVSIKKEMVETLGEDTEPEQRENVINNLKEYLIERDKLMNTGMYAKNFEDKKTI